MKTDKTKESLLKLEKMLFKAAQEQKVFLPGALWQQNIMRNIRQIGPLKKTTVNLIPEPDVIWKFAVFSSFLAVFCLVYYSFQIEILTSYLFTSFFYDGFINLLAL